LSAPPVSPSLAPAFRAQHPVTRTHVGLLSPFPPTLGAVATFSAALADGLCVMGADVSVVRVADGSPASDDRIVGELVNGSGRSVGECVELLNQSDIAVLQYDDGTYGNVDADELVNIIDMLRVPSVVVAHTILKTPTAKQKSQLEWIAATADRVVVMTGVARQRLCSDYRVDRRKVVMISHGGIVPSGPRVRRPSRPTLLTWGLLGPGKGIERVIEAMGSLKDLPGRPRYLVAGPTHPRVLAADGEAYRDARMEQATRIGVADSVSLDGRYWNRSSLPDLVQSAAIVVLPYDSTDQVTSGVLVDAVVSGRPVVATAFPHAEELLSGGAGIVVGHDDPDALVAAIRSILTQPRLAGSMAAEARRLAPQMAWSAVVDEYLLLAHRLIAERRAVL
jgi:polysaccharide biosynthesis protein PslF